MKSGLYLSTLIVFLIVVLVPSAALAKDESPPLPLHGIEGMGGVFSTYSAYLVNPAKPGKVFGLPSAGLTHVHLGNGRHLEAFTLTETLWDRVELGYAWNRLDIGDLPQEVEQVTGLEIEEDSVDLHHFNARIQLIKEGNFDQPWLPALTLGCHYKTNQDIDSIDDDLEGTLDSIGIKDDDGLDFTLYASKMVTALPRPVLFNLGLRSTEAAHLGLLGFTNERELLFEGNVVVFVTDQLGMSVEYRQKPDEYDEIPGLVEEEEDWFTICGCYVVNEHFSISGGYGNFGDVLNHQANNSWGVKFKWEF